jgi:hypothetical protein
VTRLNPDLIKDLARLTKKYKPKDWEELGRLLKDPEQLETFRLLVDELAKTSKKNRSPAKRKSTKPSRSTKVRDALAAMRKEDPARADLLEDIWLKLRQRDLLPTIAAVRAFAEALGSKGLKSSRRDEAVAELMELFLELPGDTLEEKMRQTAVEDRQLGNEYEAWVNLILRRPPRDPPQASPSK